jgi:hypothetical protein
VKPSRNNGVVFVAYRRSQPLARGESLQDFMTEFSMLFSPAFAGGG